VAVDYDQLLEELADMHVFLDVDLSDLAVLRQYSSVPRARTLVLEATDAVGRAQSRPGPLLERRAVQAVRLARQAVKKAGPVIALIRIRDKLRDKLS
jgi:hypothetical protein